jgi:hypothetical protein
MAILVFAFQNLPIKKKLLDSYVINPPFYIEYSFTSHGRCNDGATSLALMDVILLSISPSKLENDAFAILFSSESLLTTVTDLICLHLS